MATVRPLCPRHVFFYDPKISVRAGFFNVQKYPGFFIICYFLNILHILIVVKMEKLQLFLKEIHDYNVMFPLSD